MQWGLNEEPYWKSPQRSQSITLIRSQPQQGAAPINTWTKGIFLCNHGLSKEEPNVSSQSPSSVKSGSRSQPQLKIIPALTGLSSLPPRHKDVAKRSIHINAEIELYVMKINSQGYPWGYLSWKLSSAPHFQRSPHQLQLPIQTVQWTLPGNTPDDQRALQMNHTLKCNNLMMPSSGYSAHGYN